MATKGNAWTIPQGDPIDGMTGAQLRDLRLRAIQLGEVDAGRYADALEKLEDVLELAGELGGDGAPYVGEIEENVRGAVAHEADQRKAAEEDLEEARADERAARDRVLEVEKERDAELADKGRDLDAARARAELAEHVMQEREREGHGLDAEARARAAKAEADAVAAQRYAEEVELRLQARIAGLEATIAAERRGARLLSLQLSETEVALEHARAANPVRRRKAR